MLGGARGKRVSAAIGGASLVLSVALVVACGGDDSAAGTPSGAGGSSGASGSTSSTMTTSTVASGGKGGTGGTSSGTAGGGAGGTTGGSGGTSVDGGADGPRFDGGGTDGSPEGGGVASRPGMDFVAGGVRARSTNFTIILTLGESPGGNGLAKSTLYQVRGGLVSSTQR